jgi:hypothetical protein
VVGIDIGRPTQRSVSRHRLDRQYPRRERCEPVRNEVIELAREDPHLGAQVTGFSPLLAARYLRQHCIGFTRDPATVLRELPLLR